MTFAKTLAALAVFAVVPLNAAQKSPKNQKVDKPKAKAAAAADPTPVSFIKGNLTLERAVMLALRQNPEILQAQQEIERTRGQVLEVRAQALPHVNLTTNYTQQDKDLLERQSSSRSSSISLEQLGVTDASGGGGGSINLGGGQSSSNFGGDKSWRIAIEARQVLYSGGQVGAALKIAKYTQDQSIYALRDIVDRVISRARSQYYAVLLNRKLIVVAEESIQLLQDELKDQKNRFEAGTVPKFNVLRAEVAVANAKPDLIRARNNYLIAQLELAKTLGLEASRSANSQPTFEVVGELRVAEQKLNQAQAMELARDRRSSLKAQKQNILNEEQQIVVARAGYKPRLDVNTGYEMRNSRLTDNLSKEANGWFFGVDGSWAIFDGHETKGKVIQANARLAAARISYDDSVRLVELEVQKAFASLGEARELIASQGKVVEQATEALRLARERLAAGAGTQLDVLDAQVALTTARTTQQQALYDYNVALAEFDRATGKDTVDDNTYEDTSKNVTKAKLRKGQADLRAE